MDQSRINILTNRAIQLLDAPTLSENDITSVEKELNIIFPREFKDINKRFRYDYFDTFTWVGFPNEVISTTNLFRREVNFPNKYIVLADEGDGGITLMETQDDPEKPTPIYWCDWQDIDNLAKTGKFKFNPDIWPSFTDFFEYCVNKQSEENTETSEDEENS